MKSLNTIIFFLLISSISYSQAIDLAIVNKSLAPGGLSWTFDLQATANSSYTGMNDNWSAMNVRFDLQLPTGVTVTGGTASMNSTFTESGGVQANVPGAPTPPYNAELGLTATRSDQSDLSSTPATLGTFTINFSGPVLADNMINYRATPNVSGSFWNNPDDPTTRREFGVEPAQALPIVLKSFDAYVYEDYSGKLEWETSSEVNGSHFEIFRSTDTHNWESIGFVDAVGESSVKQQYEFIDRNVGKLRNNETYYYQLKMVDLDGSSELSGIRSITFDFEGIEVVTYPNPTRERLFINIISDDNYAGTNAEVHIFDNSGKIIQKNDLTLNGITDISVVNVPTGIYVVKIIADNNVFTRKLIKVD